MKTIKVLHLCSYFNTSSLYQNLFDSNDKKGIIQDVFIPMYKGQELVSNYGTVHEYKENYSNIQFDYQRLMLPFMRFLLILRTIIVAKWLRSHYEIKSYSLLHAHSLLFNGGIAYYLNKRFGVKYIVAVRNTDLKVLKTLPIYRLFAKKIIDRSDEVVFISESLKNKFLSMLPYMRELINDKLAIIPNGIKDDWYGCTKDKTNNTGSFHFLYQGTLHHRKRVPYIIQLVDLLNEQGYDCDLLIVGEGPDKSEVISQIDKATNQNKFKLLGWSNSETELKSNYLSSDAFIMLSYDETFGISYIEALASGIPVVYTKGDGIDGMLHPYQGIGLECKDMENDINELKRFIDNYSLYFKNTSLIKFDWTTISNRYIKLYKEVLGLFDFQ